MPRLPRWLIRQGRQRDPPAKCAARKDGPLRARAGPAPSPTPLHRRERRMRGGQSRRITSPPPSPPLRRLRKGRGKGSEVTLLHFPRNAKKKGDWGAGGRGDARTRRREGAGERSLAAGLRPGRPRELGPQPGLSRPDPTPPECRGIGAGVAASDRRSLSEDHRASPGGRQGEGAVRRRSWLRRRGVPTRPPGHTGLPGSSSAAPPPRLPPGVVSSLHSGLWQSHKPPTLIGV